MREITLLSVTLEGFRSYKDKTHVGLSTAAGFKFFGGKNVAEPRLGANGTGKSTFWNAVVWCLYNTSTEGLRAAELVSWTEERCMVETRWLVDGSERTVVRLGKPDRLSLDGAPARQSDIDAIWMPRARFLHSVIFGQKVELFADLDLGARAALLDDVLDLGIWLKKAERASAICSDLDREITEKDRELARAEGIIAGIDADGLEDLRRHESEWNKKQASAILDAADKLTDAKTARHAAKKALDSADGDLVLEKHQAQALLRMEQNRTAQQDVRMRLARVREHASRATQHMAFLIDHSECPTCRQQISKKFIKDELADSGAALDVFDADERELADKLSALIVSFKEYKEEHEGYQEKRNILAAKRNTLKTAYALAVQECAEREREVELLKAKQENPYSNRISVCEKALARAEKDKRFIARSKAVYERERALTDYWRVGFKRIRLWQIDQTLAYLALETNNALQSLGLVNWQISYATETETKSGTTKYGVQILVTSPKASASWAAWSGGEHARLRLAVTLGLSALIQSMSGVHYTFEVFDEPSAWMSDTGITDLLATLADRAHSHAKCVWLVDHRSLDRASFDETWLVTKRRNGSSVERVA